MISPVVCEILKTNCATEIYNLQLVTCKITNIISLLFIENVCLFIQEAPEHRDKGPNNEKQIKDSEI